MGVGVGVGVGVQVQLHLSSYSKWRLKWTRSLLKLNMDVKNSRQPDLIGVITNRSALIGSVILGSKKPYLPDKSRGGQISRRQEGDGIGDTVNKL